MTKVVSIAKTKGDKAQLMDVLNKLMDKTNININQLSKNTGLANTTIKRMCTDPDSNPTLDSIIKIAEFFEITANQLIGAEPVPDEISGYQPNFKNWDKVPIINLNQVINWPKNIETVKAQHSANYVFTDIGITEEIFAVLATDETLEPKFSEGTILIFDPNRTPKNKDYAVLLFHGKDLPQFRQILIDGPDMYARTINPTFSESGPVRLEKGKFQILGILIQAKANYI